MCCSVVQCGAVCCRSSAVRTTYSRAGIYLCILFLEFVAVLAVCCNVLQSATEAALCKMHTTVLVYRALYSHSKKTYWFTFWRDLLEPCIYYFVQKKVAIFTKINLYVLFTRGKEPYIWKINSPTFTTKKTLLNVSATLFKIGMQRGANATDILLHSILMLLYLIYFKPFCGSRLTFEWMYGSFEHITRHLSWQKFTKVVSLLNCPIQNDYRADFWEFLPSTTHSHENIRGCKTNTLRSSW